MAKDAAQRLNARLAGVFHQGELPRVACAFAGFFLILCSYYILRPVRDEMAVRFGTGKLQWLFTATFLFTLMVVPLFGWVVRTLPRRRVLPVVYGFLALNLAAFQMLFATGGGTASAAAFFVWLSVFNLFVVSLFWSRMGDCFTTEDSHRLYGYIAAGGTCGALAGPAVTALLARHVSSAVLVALSATLLVIAVACLLPLRGQDRAAQPSRPLGGSIMAGIGLVAQSPELRLLALVLLCYTAVSTSLYMELVRAVGATYATAGERTRYFAGVDFAVNSLALGLQLLGTRKIVTRCGLRVALPMLPLFLIAGLGVLAMQPGITIIACLQVAHRAGEYALSKPGREMIYTTLEPESRYKAKNFIDTAVYRAGDAASAWVIAALRQAGLDAATFAAIPAIAWLLSARKLGARHDRNQST